MRITRTRRYATLAIASAAAIAVALAGCSSGGSDDTSSGSPNDSTTTSGSGDTGSGGNGKDSVSYALPVGTGPNWILPLSSPDKLATHNAAVKQLMWIPVVATNGTSGTYEMDTQASAVDTYEVSDDGLTVTMHLQDINWSDGKPVSSRDVEFWYNLAKYNSTKLGGYSEGLMPDNIVKFEIVDEKTFAMTFDKVYNEGFLIGNQISLMYPMPQHVWDKKSADGEIGDWDKTEADAVAVFDYLFSESEDMSTYATNPLWKTISGPYSVKSWSDSGKVELVINPDYNGPDKASIANVTFLPFTSIDAEMNVVRSGEVDYGYINSAQLESEKQFTDLGYEIVMQTGWSITYAPYNFANPDMGPVFKQLYIRQALQQAIDQETISDVIWKGAATPDYGPIPQNPPSDYLSKVQADNPYPFDLDKAAALLEENGWTAGSDGIRECTKPGTGAGQCGEGIEQGKKLVITAMPQNGSQETDNMWAEIQSSFEKIGVKLEVSPAPLDSVLTEAQTCKSGDKCEWQLVFFGTAGSWYFPAYPTGERVFAKDTKWNCGQYDNPEAEKLINEATVVNDPQIMQQYSALLAEDLPVLWLPNPVYQISAINTGLDIGEHAPSDEIMPQRWTWES